MVSPYFFEIVSALLGQKIQVIIHCKALQMITAISGRNWLTSW